MSRASFRQADIQRIIRAANAEGAVVEIDLRTLLVRITPGVYTPGDPDAFKDISAWQEAQKLAPDAKESLGASRKLKPW